MENIFTKLTLKEKQIALHLLAKEGKEVLVKVHTGRFLKVRPQAVYLSDYLAIRLTPNDLKMLQNSNKKNPDGVMIFQIKSHRYFLETKFLFRKNGIFLDFSEKLYQLQRRKSARIPLPENFPQSFRVIERNGIKQDISGHINNISSGGLNFRIPAHLKMRSQEKIRTEFQILSMPFLRLSGQVRYIRRGQNFDSVGFSFEALPKSLENRLLLTIMDVQMKTLYPTKKLG